MLESTFHEAIRSGDVAARLIYADWLEEQGRLVECSMLRSGRWCLIPAGTFWMGGGGGVPGDKQVEIPRAFYLGTYPVTQREWQDVMGRNPSWFSRTGKGRAKVKRIRDAELAEFPVECVSWDDAQDYIRRRNEQDQQSGWVYCLPTEAEWEYACRGAAITAEESSFDYYLENPSKGLSNRQANFRVGETSLHRTTRVGSYQTNRLGLFDMHGNVWEWCDDRFKRTKPYKVLRGGSWNYLAGHCHAASRDTSYPDYYAFNISFRLARVPLV